LRFQPTCRVQDEICYPTFTRYTRRMVFPLPMGASRLTRPVHGCISGRIDEFSWYFRCLFAKMRADVGTLRKPMTETILQVKPILSWPSGDEATLIQTLNSIEYDALVSNADESTVRTFKYRGALNSGLGIESDRVMACLIPCLHCYFKIELTGDGPTAWRWTQTMGEPPW
jgi:hypothetical protein